MGLSASQGRLLSLTSRLSDLEFKAQTISNNKVRLSAQAEQASNNYMAALDKQTLKVFNQNTQTNVDANLYNLTTYGATGGKQKMITDSSGRIMISQDVADAYNKAKEHNNLDETNDGKTFSSLNQYLKNYDISKDANGDYTVYNGGYPKGCDTDAQKTKYAEDRINYLTNRYDGTEKFLREFEFTSDPRVGNGEESDYTYDTAATSHYKALFEQMDANGYVVANDSQMKDSEWLQSQIEMGNIFLTEFNKTGGSDGDGAWEEISWATGDSELSEVSDETNIAKAEAEYNTVMARIEGVDKKYDMDLQSVNTEHSAIQTELESVKNVINKNTERSFKLFS